MNEINSTNIPPQYKTRNDSQNFIENWNRFLS
jgi:hypothetical protein